MKILAPLLLSCKEASELIDRQDEHAFSMGDKIRLRAHLLACGLCRRYDRQSAKLDQLLHSRAKGLKLDPESTQNFKSKLKQEIPSRGK